MTNTTDVNEKFAAVKEAQKTAPADRLAKLRRDVAEGKMTEKDNGDGTLTFKVLTGWDANETFRFNLNSLDLIMNTGLATTVDGKVALYLNGQNAPAWHGLGTVIPGGLSDSDSVLKAAGLDWEVEKRPNEYRNIVTGEMEILDRQYLTFRTDTGKAIGPVGEIYTEVQNWQAYEMLSELIGLGMVCDSAGELEGGATVFVTAEIPEPVVIDPNGIADKVRQFLAIKNSHNGKGQVMGVVSPWRILCGNTARFAVRDASATFKIRHTKNAMNKIAQAREALAHTVDYFAAFAAEENTLVQASFTHEELDMLIRDVWEVKTGADGQPSKRGATISANRTELVHALFDAESERVGRNAFAAENAITGFVDHFADLRPRGALKGNRLAALGNAILNEDNDAPKSKAHEKLMLTVRNR